MKEKTPETLHALVSATRATKWREFPEALGPLAQYAAPECLSAVANPGVNTDAALVVLQSLISRIEVIADGPYRVEHDQSKNLLTYHDLLQRFIDHDQEIEFRQTEIATIKFPLKLAEVTQVNSKASPAVQLADVMIGAAIEAGNSLAGLRSGGLDPEAVLSLYADNQLIHLIPSIDFEEQRQFRQGTQAAERHRLFLRQLLCASQKLSATIHPGWGKAFPLAGAAVAGAPPTAGRAPQRPSMCSAPHPHTRPEAIAFDKNDARRLEGSTHRCEIGHAQRCSACLELLNDNARDDSSTGELSRCHVEQGACGTTLGSGDGGVRR